MARFLPLAVFAAAAVRTSALSAHSHSMLATVDVAAIPLSSHLGRAAAAAAGEPEQLHLSLTGSPTEMFVTFVLPNISAPCADAAVAVAGGASFPASHLTYTAGVIGWFGSIYTSRLTGLAPGSRYTYTATACGVSAPAQSFNAAPQPGPGVLSRLAVKGDMGTVIPLGFAVAEQIEKDGAEQPFDLAVLAGDLAYATVSPPKDEVRAGRATLATLPFSGGGGAARGSLSTAICALSLSSVSSLQFEAVWDAWGRMIQPYTATLPFMACVGNHGECTPRRTAARGGSRERVGASTPPLSHCHAFALLRARAQSTRLAS